MSVRSIASIPGIVFCLTACGPSDIDFSEFSTFKSPDEEYIVVIDSAHSKLAFGPETIRVYVVEKDKRERTHIVTTKIANDGGGITDSNVKAKWIQPGVIKFCLSGVEQEDKVVEINVRTLTHIAGKENCW